MELYGLIKYNANIIPFPENRSIFHYENYIHIGINYLLN